MVSSKKIAIARNVAISLCALGLPMMLMTSCGQSETSESTQSEEKEMIVEMGKGSPLPDIENKVDEAVPATDNTMQEPEPVETLEVTVSADKQIPVYDINVDMDGGKPRDIVAAIERFSTEPVDPNNISEVEEYANALKDYDFGFLFDTAYKQQEPDTPEGETFMRSPRLACLIDGNIVVADFHYVQGETRASCIYDLNGKPLLVSATTTGDSYHYYYFRDGVLFAMEGGYSDGSKIPMDTFLGNEELRLSTEREVLDMINEAATGLDLEHAVRIA